MLGDALRLIRTFHDMKQGELAESLGLSKSYISEIERNNREPAISTIRLYADFFDIPASSILFFAENIEDKSQSARANRFISKKVLAIMEVLAQRKSPKEIDA